MNSKVLQQGQKKKHKQLQQSLAQSSQEEFWLHKNNVLGDLQSHLGFLDRIGATSADWMVMLFCC